MFSTSLILALQGSPVSLVFSLPLPGLELATSLNILGSFYWRTVFRNCYRLTSHQIQMLNLKCDVMICEHGAFER